MNEQAVSFLLKDDENNALKILLVAEKVLEVIINNKNKVCC